MFRKPAMRIPPTRTNRHQGDPRNETSDAPPPQARDLTAITASRFLLFSGETLRPRKASTTNERRNVSPIGTLKGHCPPQSARLDVFLSEYGMRVFLKGMDDMYTGDDCIIAPLTALTLWRHAREMMSDGRGRNGLPMSSAALHEYWLHEVRPLEMAYPATRLFAVRDGEGPEWMISTWVRDAQHQFREFAYGVKPLHADHLWLGLARLVTESQTRNG